MAGARAIFIRAIIAVVILLAVWLLAGRQISMLLDLAFTVSPQPSATTPLSFESTAFWVGEVPLSVSDNGGRKLDVTIHSDDASRLVVSARGSSISLGEIAPAKGAAEFPDGKLAPDAGDEVTLTVRRSFMSWPTPFEMNFMTGQAPSWKRHLYYHLHWKKRSGAQIELVWRYEQWYYKTQGWTNGMMVGPGTGLMECKITPARAR